MVAVGTVKGRFMAEVAGTAAKEEKFMAAATAPLSANFPVDIWRFPTGETASFSMKGASSTVIATGSSW
jgi:hypothetical protein